MLSPALGLNEMSVLDEGPKLHGESGGIYGVNRGSVGRRLTLLVYEWTDLLFAL